MKLARASSWNELQDLLFAEGWNPALRRLRPACGYRGLADAGHELLTSLSRLGGRPLDIEHHLLRSFRKYGHRFLPAAATEWHLVCLAQHYGLPTRLLDWTHSPFVALHFATADPACMDRDGTVWRVNYERVHARLPGILRALLREEGAVLPTVDMLARALDRVQDLGALARENFLLFFEPPSLDDRIANQAGFFSVMADPGASVEHGLSCQPDGVARILVPAELKWEVRDRLDQAGINERVLFPGLQGLAAWLARHYGPRPAAAGIPEEPPAADAALTELAS